MTSNSGRPSPLSTLKRYALLAYGCFGTMLDVGLMVLGSLFVGLSLTVLLAGFEIVDVVLELSTGAMLVSALVLAVAGLFCLGVATEGPLGRGRRLSGYNLWEIGIGRIVAVVVIGYGAILLQGALAGLVEGLPAPLQRGVEGLRAVGVSGATVMPLVGVPLSVLALWAPVKSEWMGRAEVPVMFVVWVVAAMANLS